MSTPTWSFPALGFLGAHTAAFPSQLREGTDRRPTLHVTLTVPVSHEDVEAILWWLTEQGIALDELANPESAVFYLCDALAHEPTHVFEYARHAIGALSPGSVEDQRYRQLRALVEGLIGPRPDAAPAPRSRRSTPTTVATLPASVGELAGVAR